MTKKRKVTKKVETIQVLSTVKIVLGNMIIEANKDTSIDLKTLELVKWTQSYKKWRIIVK